MRLFCRFAVAVSLAASLAAYAQPSITTPMQAFGFNIGDDYHVANYTQLETYFKKLATESDRMKLVDIGPSAEGRHQWMAILSSPENLKHLDKYRDISSKLAHAEGLSDEQAHALAAEGKAVVWIDGGLHASETVGAQQLIETVYHLASDSDAEMMRILNDTVVLCVLDNPDGMEMVANWYMRTAAGEKAISGAESRESGSVPLPRLWQKYAGHDNNRDFFMSNLSETTNINRVLFREWYPQIMYNHHQAGPPGTIIFVPPFRDPFNYHFDPLIPLKIESVGMAIHTRLVEENKPGSVMRNDASYSTWYNGGLRTVTYFHNMIGILTEIIGSPTPMQVPLVPARQLPSNDQPYPITPGLWHYRQSIDYEVTNNRAILDYASRNRETLLYDTYRMGKNSIQRGSEDSWTVTPKRIAALEDAAKKNAPPAAGGRGEGRQAQGPEGGARVPSALYKSVLHDPAQRDPRVYILSADQPDFPTATKFVNTLIKNGVTVLCARAQFQAGGKSYPAESYVIRTAQAYRPHILDMFEPQDHPNDFRYPGGPPVPPYDVTGYTLAMQMGVQFDRLMEAVDGPFAPITTDLAAPPAGSIVRGHGKVAGYLVSHSYNDAFILSNRLLKAGQDVYWVKTPIKAEGHSFDAGALWIPETNVTRDTLESFVKTSGVTAFAVSSKPVAPVIKLKQARIALYDRYGGTMPSGWLRFIFEQFEFPYTVVYPQQLDAGNLRDHFDVLIFADGGVNANGVVDAKPTDAQARQQPKAESIPGDVRPLLGFFSKTTTLPQVQAFVNAGGRVITVGSSNYLSQLLSLPIEDALTEVTPGGTPRRLAQEKFYIPGSVLQADVDTATPFGYGMAAKTDVFFDNSPAFRLSPNAPLLGVKPVAWYGNGTLLRSGWAWGEAYLHNSVAALDAPMGKGDVLMLGPEVTFRGQPHGTFKLLFNGIMAGTLSEAAVSKP